MKHGQKRPDPLPKLIAAHAEAWKGIRSANDGPVVLIGKKHGIKDGMPRPIEGTIQRTCLLRIPIVR